MSEYIVDTFGIVQDLADLHGEMNMPLYHTIMNMIALRQHEEIVRCDDCKYFDPYTGSCARRDYVAPMAVTPDGFCKWGEHE